jgi:hypothetical protein
MRLGFQCGNIGFHLGNIYFSGNISAYGVTDRRNYGFGQGFIGSGFPESLDGFVCVEC